MNYNVIFFIGPQGSGKGTQAKILASKLGFFYWEMGGILREVAKQDTELGRNVKDLLARGVLLQDDLLLEVVKSKLETMPKDQGLIFDGIPRRIGQAEFLLNYLKEAGKSEFATIFIDLPKEESLGRLLLRAEKEGRADDTKEAILFRLEQYEKDTLPVLGFLKNEGQFFNIDGRPSVEEVTNAIDQVLDIN